MILLYEGRQIFFGNAQTEKSYFTNLGFVCPDRAIVADFLTSLTNPAKRVAQEGYEHRVPRTPEEFASVWKRSSERAELLREIEDYCRTYPLDKEGLDRLRAAQASRKATKQ